MYHYLQCDEDIEDLGPNVTTGRHVMHLYSTIASVTIKPVSLLRVVYLTPPEEPKGPVISGTAVIDSGDYLGQRVQFDRTVCFAFGFSLAKADLSFVFSRGKRNLKVLY